MSRKHMPGRTCCCPDCECDELRQLILNNDICIDGYTLLFDWEEVGGTGNSCCFYATFIKNECYTEGGANNCLCGSQTSVACVELCAEQIGCSRYGAGLFLAEGCLIAVTITRKKFVPNPPAPGDSNYSPIYAKECPELGLVGCKYVISSIWTDVINAQLLRWTQGNFGPGGDCLCTVVFPETNLPTGDFPCPFECLGCDDETQQSYDCFPCALGTPLYWSSLDVRDTLPTGNFTVTLNTAAQKTQMESCYCEEVYSETVCSFPCIATLHENPSEQCVEQLLSTFWREPTSLTFAECTFPIDCEYTTETIDYCKAKPSAWTLKFGGC